MLISGSPISSRPISSAAPPAPLIEKWWQPTQVPTYRAKPRPLGFTVEPVMIPAALAEPAVGSIVQPYGREVYPYQALAKPVFVADPYDWHIQQPNAPRRKTFAVGFNVEPFKVTTDILATFDWQVQQPMPVRRLQSFTGFTILPPLAGTPFDWQVEQPVRLRNLPTLFLGFTVEPILVPTIETPALLSSPIISRSAWPYQSYAAPVYVPPVVFVPLDWQVQHVGPFYPRRKPIIFEPTFFVVEAVPPTPCPYIPGRVEDADGTEGRGEIGFESLGTAADNVEYRETVAIADATQGRIELTDVITNQVEAGFDFGGRIEAECSFGGRVEQEDGPSLRAEPDEDDSSRVEQEDQSESAGESSDETPGRKDECS